MNQERLYHTISNLEPWFFPEFVLLFDVYKINPWIIPIKLLIFHFHFYEKNISQNEKIDVNKKKNLSILANQKEYLELENSNQKKTNNKVKEILYQIYENKTKIKILKRITREQTLKRVERKNN